jgi:threonine dehydrogenase-like Zn-dependent dehydrogenase
MRQLTLLEPKKVEWQEVPEPVIDDGRQALVRPIAVALCDADQPAILGESPAAVPVALGHEFVADVAEVGEDVATVSVGDRVIVPFQISCGHCVRCAGGQTGDCTTVDRLSMYGFGGLGGPWGGALSDLVRVPFADAMLLALPGGVEPATVASASDNIPDGWRTVAGPLERTPQAEVLVMGGGTRSIALYAVQVALMFGASRVVYADTDAERLAKAQELGAEPLEGIPKRTGPFPITVDGSASREGFAAALRSTEPGGICTHTGIIYEPETPLPVLEMYTNGLELHIGRAQARATIPKVLDAVAAGRLHPEQVTSGTASWDDAAEAVFERQTKLIITRD